MGGTRANAEWWFELCISLQCPGTHCNLIPSFGTCYFNCGKLMGYAFIHFYSYDQNIWHNCEGKKLCFRAVSEKSDHSVLYIWPYVLEQNIMEEDHVMEKLPNDRQEVEKRTGKSQGQELFPITYFLLYVPSSTNISLARRQTLNKYVSEGYFISNIESIRNNLDIHSRKSTSVW